MTNFTTRKNFYGPDPAVIIEDMLFIKGPDDKVLRLIRDADGRFKNIRSHLKPDMKDVELPHGEASILQECSYFYRQSTQEADLEKANE